MLRFLKAVKSSAAECVQKYVYDGERKQLYLWET
jgi:hypothetical protein